MTERLGKPDPVLYIPYKASARAQAERLQGEVHDLKDKVVKLEALLQVVRCLIIQTFLFINTVMVLAFY